MTRSVLFDTETTGLEPHSGHRIIEVAAVELVNDLPTGKHFHALLDPEREVPDDATRVHGLSTSHLAGKPRFGEVVTELLSFLGDDTLVAHNAPFDLAFLNAELGLLGLPLIDPVRMIDTLVLAKARFPGLPNSLDALCRRFSIDLTARYDLQRRAGLSASGQRLCRAYGRSSARFFSGHRSGGGSAYHLYSFGCEGGAPDHTFDYRESCACGTGRTTEGADLGSDILSQALVNQAGIRPRQRPC